MTRLRHAATLFSLILLAACVGPPKELDPSPEPIGDFRLGFNVVVANDVTKGPTSRNATEEELSEAVKEQIEARLGRYDGDGLYHIGLRVEGYVLARPGVPIIYSPQSVILLALNVWDDATQVKLTEDAVRITAFEGGRGGGPLMSSGLINSREEQLENLAREAARQVEKFLKENEATWFAPKEGRERVEFDRNAKPDDETSEPPAEATGGN